MNGINFDVESLHRLSVDNGLDPNVVVRRYERACKAGNCSGAALAIQVVWDMKKRNLPLTVQKWLRAA